MKKLIKILASTCFSPRQGPKLTRLDSQPPLKKGVPCIGLLNNQVEL